MLRNLQCFPHFAVRGERSPIPEHHAVLRGQSANVFNELALVCDCLCNLPSRRICGVPKLLRRLALPLPPNVIASKALLCVSWLFAELADSSSAGTDKACCFPAS